MAEKSVGPAPTLEPETEVLTRSRCSSCVGTGQGRSGANGGCSDCQGAGRKARWVPLSELLDLLLRIAISRDQEESAEQDQTTAQLEASTLYDELFGPFQQALDRLTTCTEQGFDRTLAAGREMERQVIDLQTRVYRLESQR